MPYSLQLPNGQIVHGIDDNLSTQEAMSLIRERMPEAFPEPRRPVFAPEPPKKRGWGSSLARGAENLISSSQTGLEATFGDAAQAAERGEARQQALGQKYTQEVGLQKIKDVYEKDGLAAAAKEVVRQFPHVLAEQAPQIALTIAGAKAGAALGTLAAPGVGTIAGSILGGAGALLPQYVGANVERQAEAQRAAGEQVAPDVGKAALAGAGQAALDYASLRLLGGNVVAKWMGLPGRTAEQELVKAATRSMKGAAAAGAGRGLVEIPTEVAQQVIERSQAGLPLLDEDALAEYGDAAYMAGMVGPTIGGVAGVVDRSSAKGQLAEKKRQEEIAAFEKQQADEAARKATPEYLNSVEGLQEQYKALQDKRKALTRQIGSMRTKEEADPVAAEEKRALEQEHKALLGQIKAMSERIAEAKKSPEQRFIEQVTKREPEPQAPSEQAAELDPKWEADTRKQMAARGAKKREIDAYIENVRSMQSRRARSEAPAPAFDYHNADATEALLLSITNPEAYALWQQQAQREREAGQLPRFGEAGQLPAPVEDMAPVFGPDGKVTGYRPIAPGEGAAPPAPLELGVQLPGGVQQDFDLGEPPRGPAPSLQLPMRKFGAPVPPPPSTAAPGRAVTGFASAAPMAPAGVRQQEQFRIALPGQAMSPRPDEAIPPDAVAPPPPSEGQGALPLPPTEEVLADAVIADSEKRPEALLPRKASGQRNRVIAAADAKTQAKEAYDELTESLDALRKKETGATWKLDSPEGVAARNPFKAAKRPEIQTPTKVAALMQKVELARQRFVRAALREVIEKRAQLGLPPITREDATRKLVQIDALMRELIVRALADAAPKTRNARQRTVFDKGAIRNKKHAARVQDAIARLRGDMARLYDELAIRPKLPFGRHKDQEALQEHVNVTENLKLAAQALIAREARLAEKLRQWMAGEGKRSLVTAPTEESKVPLVQRPFASFQAAQESILEQIERVKDSMLQTPRGPRKASGPGFQLGKQYLDPKLAPPAEPVEESFADAALEAEVTGRQETLPTFAPRGATLELVKLFQAKWRQARENLDWVNRAISDLGSENLNVNTLLSRMREAKARMDRLGKLLAGQKYGPMQRKQIETLADAMNEARQLQRSLRAALEESRQQDFVAMNLGLADAVGNEADALPNRRPRTVTSQTTQDLAAAERYAALELKKAEMAFEPFVELNGQIGELLDAYEEAKTQWQTLLTTIESAKGPQRAAEQRVNANIERARKELGTSIKQTTQEVVKQEQQLREVKQRFDLPLPKQEAPGRAVPLKERLSPEAQALRGEKAITDPEVARLASEGLNEAKGKRFPGEKALRNQAVQQRAFEEQTGQQGLFAEKAKQRKKRNVDAVLPQVDDFAPDDTFTPDAFNYTNDLDKDAIEPEPVNLQEVRAAVTEAANEAAKVLGITQPVTEGVLEAALPMQVMRELPQPGTSADNGNVSIFRALGAYLQHGPTELRPLVRLIMSLLPKNPDAYIVEIGPVGTRLGYMGNVRGVEVNGKRRMQITYAMRYGNISNEVFLHELLHAAVAARFVGISEALAGGVPLTREVAAAVKQFKEVYNEFVGATTNIPDANGKLGSLRAAMNRMIMEENDPERVAELTTAVKEAVRSPDEFMTYALTSPVFQRLLNAAEYKGKTLLQRFKDWVKSLFGFDGARAPSWLDAATTASHDVLSAATTQKANPALGVNVNLNRADPAAKKLYPDAPARWDVLTKNSGSLVGRTQFIDRFAPIVATAREMADTLKATQMVYFARAADRVNQFVAENLTHGPVRLRESVRPDGRKEHLFQSVKGVNLREILNTLRGEDFNTWAAYIALERAQADGVGIEKLLGEDKPRLTPEEQERILAFGRSNAAFQQARAMYRAYNDELVSLAEETGLVTERDAERMRRGDYIPFYRLDENGDIVMFQEHPVKIGNVRDQKDLAHLFGSDKALDDPFANIARNTRIILGTAIRNQMARNTAFTMQELGLGQMRRLGKQKHLPYGRNVVHFKYQGVDHAFIVDTEANPRYAHIPGDVLAKGMEGIATTMPAGLRLLAFPAKVLRMFITRNPLYVLRQLIRDPMHAWLATGMDVGSVKNGLTKLGKLMAHRDATGQLLRERGLIGGQVIQGTDEDMGRIMAQLHAGQNVLDRFFSRLDDMAVAADATTRAGLYEDFKKKGFSDMEATLGTMDSVNFATRGASPSVQWLNMTIPFFNAQIQGLDSVWRALSGQMPYGDRMKARQRLAHRALMMVGSSLLYYAMVEDEEWYQNTPETVRAANWLLPPIPGLTNEPLKIPIPFEFGLMFKALPELMLQGSRSEPESRAAMAALRNQLINSIPGGSSMGLPAAVKPAFEAMANYSTFTGRQIVPPHLQNEDAANQYLPNTLQIAKDVSTLTGGFVSPIHVEHLVRGYTAGLGYAALQLLNAAVESSDVPKPEKRTSEMMLVGPLFQRTDSTAIVNRAYAEVNRINAAVGRIKRAVDEQDPERARALMQEEGELAVLKPLAGNFRQQMGELTKLENQVRFSKSMTSEEKTERLAALRQRKIMLARQMEQRVPQ